jgi:hypothetical protein
LEEQQLLQALAAALGVAPEVFVELACSCPDLLDSSPMALRSHLSRLATLLGVSREQLVGLAVRAPEAVLRRQPGELDDQVADLSRSTGLVYSQVVEMVLQVPELLDAPAPGLASQMGTIGMVGRLRWEQVQQLVATRPGLLLADVARLKQELLQGGDRGAGAGEGASGGGGRGSAAE